MKRSMAPIPTGLRGMAILAGGLLTLAAGAAWFAHAGRQEAGEALRQAGARIADAEARLHRLENGLENVRRQAALFTAWRARGLVGPVAPREWALFLENLAQELGLPGLQAEFLSPGTGRGKDSGVETTTLRLRLGLLHEEDLLRLFDALERRAPALVSVRTCRLVRLPPQAPRSADNQTRLEADCEMDWTTVTSPPPPGQQGEPA